MEDKGFIPVIVLFFMFITGIISFIMGDASTGLANGLSGSATVSATLSKIEMDSVTEDSFSLDQRYLLGLESELSPFLRLRTDIRDLESFGDTEEGKTTERDTELFSELILQNPLFNWSAGFRLSRDTDKVDHTWSSRLDARELFSRFSWRPEGLPTLFLEYETLTDEDDVREIDTDEDRFEVTSDYTYGPLSLFNSFTYEEREDRTLELTDEEIENVGRVNFQRDFWRKRIFFLGNYQVNYLRLKEKAEETISFDELQPARRGLYLAEDTTPGTGELEDTPSLIDSDRDTPATDGLGNTINIGGGNTFRNIGVELITPEVINRVLIYVRPDDPDLSPLIVWDAYFSDDGQNWSLLGSTAFFDPVESRYEISFVELNPHFFFKVVNSATSGVLDSFVTEIEAVGPESFSAGEERISTELIQDINTTVRFSPIEKVTLSYDFFYSKSERESDGVEFTERRNTHGITLQADPFRLLSAYARYERDSSESEQNVETLRNLYSMTLRSTPWETLDASLSASRSEEAEDGVDQSRGDSISLQVISQLYRNLNAVINVGYSESRDFVAKIKTKGHNYGMDLDAELRRDLTATLSYDGIRSTETSEDDRIRTDDVRFLLIWRPTRLLNLSGEWGYRSEVEAEGFRHRYTLDWLPFPDGNINLNCFVEYELDSSGVENRETQLLNAGFRWAVNRKTDFRLTYTFDGSSNATEEKIQSLTITLDIRF